jgi:hypothetical protein
MLTYWLAHMDWPFIENKNNLVIDYHLVYAGVADKMRRTHSEHNESACPR